MRKKRTSTHKKDRKKRSSRLKPEPVLILVRGPVRVSRFQHFPIDEQLPTKQNHKGKWRWIKTNEYVRTVRIWMNREPSRVHMWCNSLGCREKGLLVVPTGWMNGLVTSCVFDGCKKLKPFWGLLKRQTLVRFDKTNRQIAVKNSIHRPMEER